MSWLWPHDSGAFLRWLWGESQRQVLPGCSDVTCYQACFGWQFHLSAGQHTCASGAWHNPTLAAWNTYFISCELWLPTVRTWSPLIARSGEPCSSVCMRCRSTMSTNSSSDWLTFGAVCSKLLSTLLSASGESVRRRVFARRKNTSNICFELFWQRNKTDDGQSMHSVFLKFLNKIIVWRWMKKMQFLCLFCKVMQKQCLREVEK